MKSPDQPSPDYQKLFESAPGLYLVLTPAFVIVDATDEYLRVTMTKRDEVVGRHLFDVFPDNPDDPEATGTRNLQNSLAAVLKTGEPHQMAIQKYDIRLPNSETFEERYWSPVNYPVFDDTGTVALILHTVEDVTGLLRLQTAESDHMREIADRKQAENELDRFFNLSLDMLCISNADGYFKRVSPAFTTTLGWSVEELLTRPFSDFVHPEDLESTMREVERQVVAGEMVLQF